MNIRKFVADRYGVELPDDIEFVERAGKIRVAKKGALDVAKELGAENNFILFARVDRDVKLTTNAMQIFLRDATKNVVVLRGGKVRDFVSGFDVVPDEVIECDGGYVVVRSDHDVLGCGFLKRSSDSWIVENLIPKSRRVRNLID